MNCADRSLALLMLVEGTPPLGLLALIPVGTARGPPSRPPFAVHPSRRWPVADELSGNGPQRFGQAVRIRSAPPPTPPCGAGGGGCQVPLEQAVLAAAGRARGGEH